MRFEFITKIPQQGKDEKVRLSRCEGGEIDGDSFIDEKD